MPDRSYTSGDLVALLKQKYSGGGWIVLEQVNEGTGTLGRSWVDAVVLGIWPSTGCTRMAFEVKVDRGDFLREIKNPAKNRWARESFNSFWYLAPAGVIKEEELPAGCGWMKPRGSGLSIVRAASNNDSAPIDALLLSSLIRSAVKFDHAQDRESVERVLAESGAHQSALMIQRAAERFVAERGGHLWGRTEEEVLRELADASDAGKTKTEREQVYARLETFQDRMVDLFEIFCSVAHMGLLERNAAGEFVMEHFGGVDKTHPAMSRARAKKDNWTTSRVSKAREVLAFLTERFKTAEKKNA